MYSQTWPFENNAIGHLRDNTLNLMTYYVRLHNKIHLELCATHLKMTTINYGRGTPFHSIDSSLAAYPNSGVLVIGDFNHFVPGNNLSLYQLEGIIPSNKSTRHFQSITMALWFYHQLDYQITQVFSYNLLASNQLNCNLLESKDETVNLPINVLYFLLLKLWTGLHCTAQILANTNSTYFTHRSLLPSTPVCLYVLLSFTRLTSHGWLPILKTPSKNVNVLGQKETSYNTICFATKSPDFVKTLVLLFITTVSRTCKKTNPKKLVGQHQAFVWSIKTSIVDQDPCWRRRKTVNLLKP